MKPLFFYSCLFLLVSQTGFAEDYVFSPEDSAHPIALAAIQMVETLYGDCDLSHLDGNQGIPSYSLDYSLRLAKFKRLKVGNQYSWTVGFPRNLMDCSSLATSITVAAGLLTQSGRPPRQSDQVGTSVMVNWNGHQNKNDCFAPAILSEKEPFIRPGDMLVTRGDNNHVVTFASIAHPNDPLNFQDLEPDLSPDSNYCHNNIYKMRRQFHTRSVQIFNQGHPMIKTDYDGNYMIPDAFFEQACQAYVARKLGHGIPSNELKILNAKGNPSVVVLRHKMSPDCLNPEPVDIVDAKGHGFHCPQDISVRTNLNEILKAGSDEKACSP